MSGILQGFLASFKSGPAVGQAEYTSPGSYTWVAPNGVTSVCVVCVGASNFGAAGGLGWKNNISVVSGNSYTINVGSFQLSSNTFFINTSTVAAFFPSGNSGGTYFGDGGGIGGNAAGTAVQSGSGAGGYTGNGGNSVSSGNGNSGSGGGGGSGFSESTTNGAGGGGVGLLGQGSNGAGGDTLFKGGRGGSSGSGGTAGSGTTLAGSGGSYGGAPGKSLNGNNGTRVHGAVRIIWGTGRSFPSTNTGNV